jgi:hypothetical protein
VASPLRICRSNGAAEDGLGTKPLDLQGHGRPLPKTFDRISTEYPIRLQICHHLANASVSILTLTRADNLTVLTSQIHLPMEALWKVAQT